jgi:DNA-binding GntR family transcriptional regulator
MGKINSKHPQTSGTFTPINPKSLKDQVYDYMRQLIQTGRISQGDAINVEQTSAQLGVSRTPLRDALLQLEYEGLVTISPRRGVVVRTLTLQDIKNSYQVIGALEGAALLAAGDSLKSEDFNRMKELNAAMRKFFAKNNFDAIMTANVEFHAIYLERCGNEMILSIVDNLRKRLHGFIPGAHYIKEWEESSICEHEKLVEIMEKESLPAAANFIRDVHWSFFTQEKYIRQYYFPK